MLVDHGGIAGEEPECDLTLSFLADDPYLNPDWIPTWQRYPWQLAHPLANGKQPLTVQLTLGPLDNFQQQLASPYPLAKPHTWQRRIGPGKHSWYQRKVWLLEEPNRIIWTGLPIAEAGHYALRLRLRYSGKGPEDREMTDHYRVRIDGHLCVMTWPQFNLGHEGKCYLGMARADLGQLPEGKHELEIETVKPWGGVASEVMLLDRLEAQRRQFQPLEVMRRSLR